MTKLEDEYRGYEVKVFVPDEAGPQVRELVMDAVVEAIEELDYYSTLVHDRKGWDLFVEGSPADHRTEAALSRAWDKIEELTSLIVQLNDGHNKQIRERDEVNDKLRNELRILRKKLTPDERVTVMREVHKGHKLDLPEPVVLNFVNKINAEIVEEAAAKRAAENQAAAKDICRSRPNDTWYGRTVLQYNPILVRIDRASDITDAETNMRIAAENGQFPSAIDVRVAAAVYSPHYQCYVTSIKEEFPATARYPYPDAPEIF